MEPMVLPLFSKGFCCTHYYIRNSIHNGGWKLNYWPRAVQMPWRRGAQGRLCQIWRCESCGAGSDVEISGTEIWYHATIYIYLYICNKYIYIYVINTYIYIYVCIVYKNICIICIYIYVLYIYMYVWYIYIYVLYIYMCIIYIYMYTCICHTYIYIFHYIPIFWIGCVWSCIQLYGLRGDTPTMGLLDRPLDGEH